MESTVKSKLDVRELGNGQREIRYKGSRFGKGVQLLLFILSIPPLLLAVVSAFTSEHFMLGGIAFFGYVVFMRWLNIKQHKIVLTQEGIIWAGGRKQLAFKDISRSLTTRNVFGPGDSNGVQFEALGATVVVVDDVRDQAVANAILDLILATMSAAR